MIKYGDWVDEKKRSRAGVVGYINKLVKGNVKNIYDDYKDENLTTLVTLQATIEEKLSTVTKLSEEIQMMIEDETEFTADFSKYTDIEVSIRGDLIVLANFVKEKQKRTNSPKNEASTSVEKKSSRVQLPKFVIKNFWGDPTCWKSFTEWFDAAIHSNTDLSNIEKMNFLINNIEGEAENAIKGLKLSNDNYEVAKKMLEEDLGTRKY